MSVHNFFFLAEKITLFCLGEWVGVYSQNPWNCFLGLTALVTLSMFKSMVLLRSWDSACCDNIPDPDTSEEGDRCTDRFLWHFSKWLYFQM